MINNEKEPKIQNENDITQDIDSVTTEKKQKFNKKRIVIMGMIACLILIYFKFTTPTLTAIKNGEWLTEDYEQIYINNIGHIRFYYEEEEKVPGTFDFLPNYIYLGKKNIIVFGDGGIKRLSVIHIDNERLKVTYGGEEYNFFKEVEDIPNEDLIDIMADDIRFFTCNECDTLIYEEKTSYYMSSGIANNSISVYKTKDKIDVKNKDKDVKYKKIPLSSKVKFYSIDINTSVTSMEECAHTCEYKELSFEEVTKFYDDSPKNAYIWLNKEQEAEIIMYTALNITEVPDEEVPDEELRAYIASDEKKNEKDYKNIREIVGEIYSN